MNSILVFLLILITVLGFILWVLKRSEKMSTKGQIILLSFLTGAFIILCGVIIASPYTIKPW